MYNVDNILIEINDDIRNKYRGDTRMCEYALFQFFKLKYLHGKNRNYVGYELVRTFDKSSNISFVLNNNDIGTLNNAGILEEIKDVKCDNYYFELLCQFYSKNMLLNIFDLIIQKYSIPINDNVSLYEKYLTIKQHNQSVFETYDKTSKNWRKINKQGYFHFRFFKLSSKYILYENILWTALKKLFTWSLNYSIVRRI